MICFYIFITKANPLRYAFYEVCKCVQCVELFVYIYIVIHYGSKNRVNIFKKWIIINVCSCLTRYWKLLFKLLKIISSINFSSNTS